MKRKNRRWDNRNKALKALADPTPSRIYSMPPVGGFKKKNAPNGAFIAFGFICHQMMVMLIRLIASSKPTLSLEHPSKSQENT